MKLYVTQNLWFTSAEQAMLYRNDSPFPDSPIVTCDCGMRFVSVSIVASFYCVPRNTVLNWIKSGKLPAFRLGNKWMIRREDLPQFEDKE